MIRATQLRGRMVIDMEAAEKLGRIDRIFLDTQARKIAGFRVSHGGALTVSLNPTLVPASSIHAIGPDAVTVHHRDTDVEQAALLDGMPRVSNFVGCTVISQKGQVLGVIDDVLISAADAGIIGYELSDGNVMAQLGRLFADKKTRDIRYIRADANLRAGRDLIIAPEDALANWAPEASSATLAVPVEALPVASAFHGDLIEQRLAPR